MKMLIPVVLVLLVMTAAFIFVSYFTFRKYEIDRLQADDSLQPWEKVSAAVGMAKYEKGRDASTEEVLRRADEAMYRKKIAMKAARTDN